MESSNGFGCILLILLILPGTRGVELSFVGGAMENLASEMRSLILIHLLKINKIYNNYYKLFISLTRLPIGDLQ